MTPVADRARVFVLDTVLTQLERHEGRVFGVWRTDPSSTTVVLAATEPADGLVAVGGTAMGDWPHVGRDASGAWSWNGQRVEILRHSSDYVARHAGLVDPSRLASSHVGIVGLGSVGLPLSVLLGRAGVGRLTLLDGERVELENLTRTGAELTDVGRLKVDAAADRIVAANPAVRVRAIAEQFPAALNVHGDLFDDVDLVVAAASNAVGFSLAERFHHRVPVVYPALHAKAASGEVFFSLGAEHTARACFTCFRGATKGPGEPLPPQSSRSWNYAAPGQELAAEPGLGADIGHVVAITASIAINILAGTTKQVVEPDRQLLLLSNRKGALLPAPFTSAWFRVARDPSCPNHADRAPMRPADVEALLASVKESA